MEQSFMKTKPVFSLVCCMSLPMVLSMLVASLYNIVDSYFVAKISEDAMTALSLVYPVQNLINAVTIGFSVGANAVISYHLGAGNQKKAQAAATQNILFNGIHGLLLTLVCCLAMPAFLGLFTDDAAIVDMGVQYAVIAFAFAPVFAISMSIEKIFQASGKMMLTMVCMLSGGIANIVLDPIFIFGLGPIPAMGIRGAALATGLGQAFSLVVYLLGFFFAKIPVKLSFTREVWNRELARNMYAVGIPACLNIALPSVMISCLNIILAAFSQSYVFVLGAYYKLQMFLYMPANGIVQGIRPLVGYNYGAQEGARVRRIYATALTLSGCILALGTLLCWVMPDALMGLFSTNPETVAAGSQALRIISLGFLASALSVISCGALEGLGMGTPSLVISLLRYVLLLVPAAYLLSRVLGPAGVWHAFWLTEVTTAAVAYWQYRKATASLSP